jgi:hypothetical protein
VIIRDAKRRAKMAQSRLWLASLLGLSLFVLPLHSHAKEKILLLSVLKEGKPDARLLRVAQDRMAKAGEELVPSNDLSNTERKCMQQECLLALAASKGSDVVLAGTVQKVKGGGQSLGVLLYDFSKMKASELSSDCERCTPDMLSQRLSELFARALAEFRGSATPSQAPIASVTQGPDKVAKVDKPPIALGLDPVKQAGTPVQAQVQAVAQAQPSLKQPFQGPTGEEPMAVVTGGPVPTQAKVETPIQKPLPTIEVVEKPRLPEKHHGLSLSPKRKILAGVLGGLALGSLVAAIALTATDGNPTTMDCNASAGVTKICVLDNKIPSSVAYVAAGAFTVGTVLTLLWPESKPQVKESAAAEAAK